MKKVSINLFISSFVLLQVLQTFAQDFDNKSNINLQFHVLPEIPLGNLGKTYGINEHFSLQLEYLQSYKYSLFFLGAIRIGDNVKNDVLAPLRNSDGFISGVNGFYADVFGRKRGFETGLGGSYLFQKRKDHIRIEAAFIRLGHWIRFIDDSRSVPQITGNYTKLYDQYTSGFGLKESVSYQFNVKGDRSSFQLGIQSSQAFTRNHRNPNNSKAWDIYLGVKFGYLLPLYRFDDGETIYY